MPDANVVGLTLLCALLFALAHLFAGKLRFLEGIPRSRWLSAAGGISVAYVFIHLLPELSEGQAVVAGMGWSFLTAIEHHVYLVALIGLALFYGLERAALRSRNHRKGGVTETSVPVFWLHMVSFALYNVLIGYLLLHREEHGLAALAWYAVAMALHFVVNDFGLREHHKQHYRRRGRWILAAAVLGGWAAGLAFDVPEAAVSVLFAFLTGGVVLNVLKEELPEDRKSRFWAFALGCFGYAALLLIWT